MNPLQLRKELLIAESELNRAKLAGEITSIIARARTFTDRAKSLASMASSAAALMAGIVSYRNGRRDTRDGVPAWTQTLFKGANVVSNLWKMFRPGKGSQKDE
jgi:hypothetical protein